MAAGGDLNTGAQGLADLYAGTIGAAGDTRVAPARLGLLYSGEIAVPVAAGIFFTAGVEFHRSAKETLVSYAKSDFTDTLTAKPGFQGIPFKLGMLYYPVEFIYVRLGASYYFAKASYFYRYTHDTFWQEWQGEATGQGIGFWGGLGLEWGAERHAGLRLRGDRAIRLTHEIRGHGDLHGFHGRRRRHGRGKALRLRRPDVEPDDLPVDLHPEQGAGRGGRRERPRSQGRFLGNLAPRGNKNKILDPFESVTVT